MSYDIWLEIPAKAKVRAEHICAIDGCDWNYTSNTSDMWRHAGCDLKTYADKKARRLVRPLRRAIARMEAHPDFYREMNAPNGWGDYEGTLRFLKGILSGCEAFPSAKIRIWC